MNKRSRKIGTYRSQKGQSFTKYKDDENYIYIVVNGYYVTIEGDGYTESQEKIQKEIDDISKTI